MDADILDTSAESHKKQVPILGAVRIVEGAPDSPTELIGWESKDFHEAERLARALNRALKSDCLKYCPDSTWRVAFALRGLHRDCRTLAHQAFPCERCAQPVAQLKLLHSRRLLLVDAELTALPGICEADLLRAHVCGVRP